MHDARVEKLERDVRRLKLSAGAVVGRAAGGAQTLGAGQAVTMGLLPAVTTYFALWRLTSVSQLVVLVATLIVPVIGFVSWWAAYRGAHSGR